MDELELAHLESEGADRPHDKLEKHKGKCFYKNPRKDKWDISKGKRNLAF